MNLLTLIDSALKRGGDFFVGDKSDILLRNAQTQNARDAAASQKQYNDWRISTGRAPVDFSRGNIARGDYGWLFPYLSKQVDYNDPSAVAQMHRDNTLRQAVQGSNDAVSNAPAYRNKEIAPRDKATLGAPLNIKQQPSQHVPEPAQEKVAGIVGKADIKVHPEDDQGNIVTLLKGIRGKWNGLNYRVPKGFESDGVSTPSILWPIISPPVHPHTIRGGIIHDWLYRHQPRGWTREQADKVFRDVIEEDGLSPLQADLAYIGLRMFGDKAWDENAKRRLIERAAQRAKNKQANNTEAEAGQAKAASEEHTMITYTQSYQAKQASLQKKADWYNPATWFESEDEKRRREAAKTLEGFNNRMEQIDRGHIARQQAIKDRDTALENAVNARVNARLAGKPAPNTNVTLGTTAAGNRDAQLMEAAFAAQQLNPGTAVPTNAQLAGAYQRGTQKANTAIAKATQKPAAKPTAVASTAKPAAQARTAPPPSAGTAGSKQRLTGRQASRELIAGNRTPEARKADQSYTAAIRRRDSAGGRI